MMARLLVIFVPNWDNLCMHACNGMQLKARKDNSRRVAEAASAEAADSVRGKIVAVIVFDIRSFIMLQQCRSKSNLVCFLFMLFCCC